MKLAKVEGLYHPNLLINGDFQVWQRGESFSNVSNQYTADRWYVMNTVTPTSTIEKAILPNKPQENISTALLINESASNNSILRYIFENECYGEHTLSFYVNGANGNILKVAINSQSNVVKTVTNDGTWIKVEITYEDVSTIYLFVDKGLTYITGIKFEFGSIATPFVPRLYAEELILCKRYYRLIYLSHSEYIASTSNEAYFVENFEQEMRTTPTINLKDIGTVTNIANLGYYAYPNRINFHYSATNAGFTRMINRLYEIEAEIY